MVIVRGLFSQMYRLDGFPKETVLEPTLALFPNVQTGWISQGDSFGTNSGTFLREGRRTLPAG